MRTLSFLIALLTVPAAASAQTLGPSERDAALSHLRSFASCVQRSHDDLQRILMLVQDSERQRERARDAAARRDAELAIEALIARAAEVQNRARTCIASSTIPSPVVEVIERDPPPDPHADAVAESGGTVRTVETNAELAANVRVVRGEQVDGHGRVDASDVRAAVRAVAPQLERCYEAYLDRGDLTARELDLVFTFRHAGPATDVDVERSGFSDRPLEQCVRQAGRALRISRPPSGGEAVFSYRLRFGR